MVTFAPQDRPPRPGDIITVWSHPAGLWAYEGEVLTVAFWGDFYYQIHNPATRRLHTIAAGMIGGFFLNPKASQPLQPE